jgi:hypothetical protein
MEQKREKKRGNREFEKPRRQRIGKRDQSKEQDKESKMKDKL